MAKITVRTNGQTLTVNASISHWTSAALAVTASGDDDIPSTTTTTISSDYDMHFANTASTAVVTVKQLDGTTLYSGTLNVTAGTGARVLNPVPDPYQLARDAGRGGALMPTGALAETFSRTSNYIANGTLLVSGRLLLAAVDLPAGLVVSSISFMSGTTAASAPTAQWMALYTSDRVLLGQTVDDTSTAWAANTVKTLAFATPKTTTYSGLHYLGLCVVASTVPTGLCVSLHGNFTGLTPMIAATADTGLTDTAPATAGSLTAFANYPYAYVS